VGLNGTDCSINEIIKLIDALSGYLLFVTIVEEGSLTLAAKKLQMPKSKVSRRLASLEQALGSQLLIRTTRKQQLTESGLLLYQSSKPHIAALSDIETLIDDAETKVKGKLSLLLPLEFFNKVISSLIIDFALTYPEIEIHCHHYSTIYPDFNHQYDLVFVLHEQELPNSNWIGKTLLSFPQSIYAATDGKLTNGVDSKQILAERAVLATENEQWLFRNHGQVQIVEPKLALVFSSTEMRVQACQRAMGLLKLPDYIGKNSPGIEPIRLKLPVVAQQLTLLYQSRNIPTKTRVFLDYFQSKIGCLI